MKASAWKVHERRTAAALGGRRVGPTGRDGPDVVTPWLVIECKERRRLPGYLTRALAKVRGQAGPGKLGLVVAHELGARSADDLVILARADFMAWFGSDPGRALGDDPGAEVDAGGGDLYGLAELARAADRELAETARAAGLELADLAGELGEG